MINFNFNDGRFQASADDLAAINALLRETGNSGDEQMHRALGSTVIGPVLQVAEYNEWANQFFTDRPVADGEIVRIAHHKPIAKALFTSLNGEPMFTRPGRKYSTIEYTSVDTGLEIGWDDMRNAGWNVLERCILESGQELARKRDALGQAVLEAAVTTASHIVDSEDVLLKASVDEVFKTAAGLGWQIVKVAVNSGTIMDMTDWVMPSNSMWTMPEALGNDIIQRGYVSNYGGAAWNANPSVPATKVYFAAAPEKTGAMRFTRGDIRTVSDINIIHRTDLHVWDQTLTYQLLNPYAVFMVEIVNDEGN